MFKKFSYALNSMLADQQNTMSKEQARKINSSALYMPTKVNDSLIHSVRSRLSKSPQRWTEKSEKLNVPLNMSANTMKTNASNSFRNEHSYLDISTVSPVNNMENSFR